MPLSREAHDMRAPIELFLTHKWDIPLVGLGRISMFDVHLHTTRYLYSATSFRKAQPSFIDEYINTKLYLKLTFSLLYTTDELAFELLTPLARST